jgi:diguanylate cyclase (GGDEF)-like protein
MPAAPYLTSDRRGPRWWSLSTLLAESGHPGVRRVLGVWLLALAVCVAGGVLNVRLGWNAIPLEIAELRFDFTFYPPLLVAVLLALWIGPTTGAVALYAANLASALTSGMALWKALLFSLAGPLEIAVLWGSMALLAVSPRLPTVRDRALYLAIAVIGPTAASLASPIWNAAHGLDVGAGLGVWRGWVLGDLLILVAAAPLLIAFSAPVGRAVVRRMPTPPRTAASYGTFVALVALVFALLGALMALGAHELLSRIPISPQLATASGEPLLPRLREISFFVASLFAVLMTTTVLFTAALARRGRADYHSALRDPLTGCLNRRFFEEMFEDRVRLLPPGVPSSVALVDIDHFKAVNDRFGHLAGDEALRRLVDRVRRHLREHDALFRWGGEEFLLLLPGTPLSDALPRMEELRREIGAGPLLEARGQALSVTVSIGVTELRSDPFDLDALLQEVDRALYGAKEAGRDRVVSSRAADGVAGQIA